MGQHHLGHVEEKTNHDNENTFSHYIFYNMITHFKSSDKKEKEEITALMSSSIYTEKRASYTSEHRVQDDV